MLWDLGLRGNLGGNAVLSTKIPTGCLELWTSPETEHGFWPKKACHLNYMVVEYHAIIHARWVLNIPTPRTIHFGTTFLECLNHKRGDLTEER